MNIFSKLAIMPVFFAGSVLGQDLSMSEVVKNFECGDLLYGLHKGTREKYLPNIERKMEQIPDNDFVFEEPVSEEPVSKELIVQLPRPKFSPKKIIYCTADVYNDSFGRATEISLDSEYITFMLSQAENKKGMTEKLKNKKCITGNRSLKFLCKRAIDFTIAQGRKILFLLDGLNMFDVVSKSNVYGPSFTASELRYIYRNWNRFKDHIAFYEEGSRLVHAPWELETQQDLWNEYERYRQNKREGAVTIIPTRSVSSKRQHYPSVQDDGNRTPKKRKFTRKKLEFEEESSVLLQKMQD